MIFPPPNFANILLAYFDFAYYLCVSPFRFTNPNQKSCQNHWKMHSSKLQKFGFIILGVLGIFVNIVSLRSVLLSSKINGRNPELYFALLSVSFAFVSRISMYKTLWFESQKFLEIVHLMASESTTFLNSVKQTLLWQSKLTWLILHTIHLIIIMFQFLLFLGLFDQDFVTLKCSLVNRAHKTLLIGDKFLSTKNESSDCNVSLADWFFVTLFILAWLNNFLVENYFALNLLISSYVLWIVSKYFRVCLENHEKEINIQESRVLFSTIKSNGKQAQMYKNYAQIKRLCKLVSSAYGSMLTCYVGNNIFEMSRNIDFILFGDDLMRQLLVVLRLIGSVTILVLSAEVVTNVKMSSFVFVFVNSH